MDGEAAQKEKAGTALLRDVMAGAIVGLIGLASASSFAAMIFVGPFAPDLGRGVGVMLVTAVVVGLIITLRSGFPHAIGGPDNNATALYALMAATVAPMAVTLPTDQRFTFLMTILAIASAIVGLALVLIGANRLARIVRFVPFPVAGGFIAATGWLVIAGAIRVGTDVPLGWDTLVDFTTPEAAGKLAATAALTLLLVAAGKWWRSPLALPAILVGATLLVHAALNAAGLSIADGQARGILLQVASSSQFWTPLEAHPAAFDLEVLAAPAGNIIALAVVMTLAILMNSTSLELDSRTEADLDHELRIHGLAGIVSATLGGVAGNISLSRSTLTLAAGATSRLCGLTMVAILGTILLVGVDVVGILPRIVLAALLAHAGLRLFWTWAVATGRRLPLADRLTILSILVLAANFGFLPALTFGVLAGCVIFVLDVSRVRIIRHIVGADENPSSLMRSDAENAILRRDGHQVQVVVLNSFIFFGSAHRLYEKVLTILAEKKPRIMIFDFTEVTGVDTSAGAGFHKITAALRDQGVQQVMAGLRPGLRRRLEGAGGLGDDISHQTTLDEALEQAENAILAAAPPADGPPQDMVDWLAQALRDPDKAHRLTQVLTRWGVDENAYLCHAGEPTDCMHFVDSGRISVLIERPDAAPLRVRGIARHTVVGEMGFFLDQPRSAALRADEPTVVWVLDHAAWERLEVEAPDVVTAFLAYLVRLQSERLGFATRQIAALQR